MEKYEVIYIYNSERKVRRMSQYQLAELIQVPNIELISVRIRHYR